MNDTVLKLDKPAQTVFFEVKERKAMPFLEIAGITGIRGVQLQQAVDQLVREKLVTLSNANDVFRSIVSIGGKYF